MDYSDFSIWEKISVALNLQARQRSSTLIYQAGKVAHQLAVFRAPKSVKKFLRGLNPGAAFMTYTAPDTPIPFYHSIYAATRELGIPLFMTHTGIAVCDTAKGCSTSKQQRTFLEGDYLLAPSQLEFDEFYRPEETMNGKFHKQVPCGDPRLALPFLRKIQDHYRKEKNSFPGLNPDRTVALFGSNQGHLGWNQEQQDEVLLKAVSRLQNLGNIDIIVKFHPRTPENNARNKIRSLGITIAGPEINSSEILAFSSYLLSPPTSVIFEAMILKKKILVIDDYSDKLRSYKIFGIPVIDSGRLPKITLEEFSDLSSHEKIIELIWGGVEDGDCRRPVLEILKQLLKL